MLPSVGRSLHTVNATCAVSGRTRICQQASVRTRTTTSSTQEDNKNDDGQPDVHGDIQAEYGPRRGGRDRRSNIRVHRPEWK